MLKTLASTLAKVTYFIAVFGAGKPSAMGAYQPKTPKALSR